MAGRSSALGSELALILIVAIWGWAFVWVKDAIGVLPELTFNALRFSVAALAFLPWLLVLRRMPASATASAEGRGVLGAGILAGAILALGYALQTLGLERTSAGRSGVITGISVVLVPIMMATLFSQRVRRAEWRGVGLALLGLLLLGVGDQPLGLGDLLVLGCAVAFAAHVVALDRLAPGRSVIRLAAAQVSTAAVLFIVAALLLDGDRGPTRDLGALPLEVWGAIALTGLVGTTLAFAVQTRAQQCSTPTRIALILALEPVFALIAGRVEHGESPGGPALFGCVLIVGGMLSAELGPQARGGEAGADADPASDVESVGPREGPGPEH
ncbi:MAG: DMT family transporter [Planctomycetota bacterium]|jgi:drug/metabolite transporter (DMT)-like permease